VGTAIWNSVLGVGSEVIPLAEGGAAGQGSFVISMVTLWLPIIFLFYFLLIRPQRKERAERQLLLDNLKKNDRVVTVGGIYGVVTNVQRENNEVTVKVDEATNTKLRMTIGSISRVVVDPSESSPSTK